MAASPLGSEAINHRLTASEECSVSLRDVSILARGFGSQPRLRPVKAESGALGAPTAPNWLQN
ncbi:MAG TPA: hypothetical protein VFA32_03685 [Dehalococcoidia bacterium]|nr:hypothetical protein [Dehalococcoidia bacterium]